MSIFVSTAKKIIDLARKCPQCGTVQIVPESERSESVKCKVCKSEIPPKK